MRPRKFRDRTVAAVLRELVMEGVFGADIELGEISEFLRTLQIGKSGFASIVNDEGEIIYQYARGRQ